MHIHGINKDVGINKYFRHRTIPLGSIGDLPESLIEAAPVQLGQLGLVRPELLRMPHGEDDSTFVRNFFSAGQALEQRQTAIPILASLSYEADKRGRSYLLQYESPDESGRLITLVTAESPSALLQGVNRLVEFDLWGSLQGDMAVWDPIDGVSAETSWVGPSFHVGGVDIFSRASFFFSQRPWLWIILLVAAALLFAATAVRLLRQQARQQ